MIVFSEYRNKLLQVTDERVKIMSEVIKSMRVIKMYCWESVIEKKIREVRK
jgi:ATP-binding cassette subfamily C (CFTR/MRP) protein 5